MYDSAVLTVLLAIFVLALVLGLGGWLAYRVRPRLWRGLKRRVFRNRRGAPSVVRGPQEGVVVLVHGLLGFDSLQLVGRAQPYFRGISAQLMAGGATVLAPRLPPLAGVPERAAALADFLRDIDARRAVLIGHSLGGIDARYALSRFGANERVSALVTVGTPHRGTWIAGLAEVLPARVLRRVLGCIGMRSEALAWLTEECMSRANLELSDAPSVFYGSIVAQTSRIQLLTNPALLASYEVLRAARGSNDALVPTSSQVHGRVLANVRADHWAQIGWSRNFDAAFLYTTILRELSAAGLYHATLPPPVMSLLVPARRAATGTE